MSVVQTLHVPPDGWTVDEVPEIEGRWELVDGVLLVPPPEAPRNSRAEFRLGGLLTPALDDGWEVLIGGGLYFDRRNHRMPDLLVCRSTAVDAGRIRAADVLLAVEVMSPSSVSTDRVTKPAQYAAAGIPHFWRLEPTTRLLVTSELAGDVYREASRFDDRVAVREPVALTFRLGDLLD